VKKLSLLAVGAAALAVAGFSSAASAHERGQVSFGIFFGGPVVDEEPGYNREAAYWAHRRWEEHRRWEAYQRARAEENCDRDRERPEHAYYAPREDWGGRRGWHHDEDNRD